MHFLLYDNPLIDSGPLFDIYMSIILLAGNIRSSDVVSCIALNTEKHALTASPAYNLCEKIAMAVRQAATIDYFN